MGRVAMSLGRVALLLALALSGSLVGAQAPAPEDSDSAREWYEAGVDLYGREEWAPALDAFRHAFALVPRPQLHFNMARCLSRLGRHREAVEELQRAVGSEELSDEERTRARAELLVERRNLGTLEVAGTGRVRVDGEVCELPCTMALDPGEHDVEYDGSERMITIEAERVARVDFTPSPPPEVGEPEGAGGSRGPYRPGVGTVIGASLIALGAGGTIGFGLRTRSLEDDFDRTPTDAFADDGEQAKLLTNLSIGVTVVGALVWLTEVIVGALRVRPNDAEEVAGRVRPAAW